MSLVSKILLVFALAFYLLVPAQAAFADDKDIFAACKVNPNATICKEQGTKKNPVINVIRVATNIIAVFAGVIAVIMVIVSGIQMITSGGNQENIANARRRLVAALIGVAIIALSWTIISFVINNLIKT